MLSEVIGRVPWAVAAFLALSCPAMGMEAVRGTLAQPVTGEPLLLLTDTGTVELALDESFDLTMRDPQLRERTWEVRGQRDGDGALRVEKIFTVKDGTLHRVTYYCVICHITTHEPGLCMCCQGDTDLRELPGE